MPNTLAELRAIVARATIIDSNSWWIVKEDGSAFYIQIAYSEVDVDDPLAPSKEQHGRKWRISRYMLPDEIFRTMFAACLASAEHRLREHFLVDGERVFGPHLNIDALIEFIKTAREKKREYKSPQDEEPSLLLKPALQTLASRTLMSLSPEELEKVKPITRAMVEWCLKKGDMEARISFPRAGENIDQLETEYREWMKANPMPVDGESGI